VVLPYSCEAPLPSKIAHYAVYLNLPPSLYKISANREDWELLIWTNPDQEAEAVVSGIQGATDCPVPLCMLCHVSLHPSAEVNFALPRQFSISVSSIVTPVVFGGSYF
jgi:hypothetical protein